MVEPTLSVGVLINLASLLVTVVALYFALVRRIDKIESVQNERFKELESKLDLIWEWFKREHINGDE